MMVCDTGAVAPFNDGARRTAGTRTLIRLGMSDRLERRLNERVRHSFSGNKAEREPAKNRPATFSSPSKKMNPNRGMGRDRTRRGWGWRERRRKEGGFKSITDEILQTEILKIQQNRRRWLQLPAHMLRKAFFPPDHWWKPFKKNVRSPLWT